MRERREDILPLARHFLTDVATVYDESPKVLSPAAANMLARYDWPGNVRELRNAVERAFLFCADRTIDLGHLPGEIRNLWPEPSADPIASRGLKDRHIPSLAGAERLLIARVLKVTGGNQSDAARLLGLERHRLRRKILLHQLEHLVRIRPR